MSEVEEPPPSAETFFSWVDELLTPAMLALGCYRIGGSINDQPSSRSRNTAGGGPSEDPPTFLLYDFGFEVSSRTALLLDADDPETGGELWLDYEPSKRRLDLGSWGEPFAEAVDWNIHQDTGPCSAAEVQRRLRVLGSAVLDFADRHGTEPTP